MEINVYKITDPSWANKACEATMRGQQSKISLDKLYKCEHSPIQTQIFWIEMKNIPTFVSVHLVRHKIGVTHYVMSNREDRGGSGKEDRYTPINHCMFINAQELIFMARKRLCMQASKETREAFQMIKDKIKDVDPYLYKYLVPECEYRNGYCPEIKPCERVYKKEDKIDEQ